MKDFGLEDVQAMKVDLMTAIQKLYTSNALEVKVLLYLLLGSSLSRENLQELNGSDIFDSILLDLEGFEIHLEDTVDYAESVFSALAIEELKELFG